MTYHGWYGPAHVEAAWIVDSAGKYIHTLEEYGRIRQVNLVSWNQASQGQAVDCVTGATITQHRAHTVTWDCIDLNNNPVPDGTYRLIAEFTEDDSAGFFGPPTKQMQIDFPKGAQPADLTVPDSASFVSVSLSYR